MDLLNSRSGLKAVIFMRKAATLVIAGLGVYFMLTAQ